MPWKELNVMDQKTRFVVLAKQKVGTITHLCQEFGISRKTGYKWLNRVQNEGMLSGVRERSRRPKKIPKKISEEIETKFINIRKKHPTWGARKLISIYKKNILLPINKLSILS